MQFTKIAAQVAESVLSVVGIRVGTEEPHFLHRPLTATIEIRQYGPRIAAETTVAADEDRARNIGFRRLARYIFGGNHRGEGIAMTAPVAQQQAGGDEIAMTAPVAQSREEDDGGWRIRFFMPAKWTMETLPIPDDDSVRAGDSARGNGRCVALQRRPRPQTRARQSRSRCVYAGESPSRLRMRRFSPAL